MIRSWPNAFLLSVSRSAGIDENAASIAMSFASAILTFNNCNSCSILSNVRFDKSFSKCVIDCDNRRWALLIQRRSHHFGVALKRHPTVYVRFGSSSALQKSSTSTAAFERLAVVRQPRFECQVLNDCFRRKRPFKFLEIKQIERLQTANSGSSRLCLDRLPDAD